MRRSLATLCVLGAGLTLAAPAAARPATTVPDALRVPDGQRRVLTTVGTGAQVYDCVEGSWRFREPVALLGKRAAPLGIHFAGPNWQSLRDGSRVTGRLLASVPASRPERDIPPLLLEASANAGAGVFGRVTFIQRLRTRGGVAPSGSCDPGRQASASVPYRSTYVFWAPVGETG